MTSRVTIIRHGQTNFNVGELIHTSSDDTINETGRKQAEQLGKFIEKEKFTRAYSSDLMRCQDTAKGVFRQLKNPAPFLILEPRLRERDYGSWDGQPSFMIFEMAKEQKIDPWYITSPGGETYEATELRVKEYFEELLVSLDNSTMDENVVIFSHGITIQHLLQYIFKNGQLLYNLKNFEFNLSKFPGNTARTVFSVGNLEPETGKRDIECIHLHDKNHLI